MHRAGQTLPPSALGGESATLEQAIFAQARRALCSVRDLLRFAVSRFETAGLVYGHGSENASLRAQSTCISCHEFHHQALGPMRMSAGATQ